MNEKQLKEIGQFCWDLEVERKAVLDKNKEIEVFENRKTVTDKIIKNLQTETDELKKEINGAHLENDVALKEIDTLRGQMKKEKDVWISKDEDHIQELVTKLKEFQTENFLNKIQIEEALNEKEVLKKSLITLETENAELKELFEYESKGKTEAKSLCDELEFVKEYSLDTKLKCSFCDETFSNLGWFDTHKIEHKKKEISAWKSREADISKQISTQMLKLSSDLLKLKEKEISDAIWCKCKAYCRVYHHKHNWRSSFSQKLIEKLDTLISDETRYSWKNCDKTFLSVVDIRKHDQYDHRKPKFTEEEDQVMITEITKKEIQCDDCNFSFKSKKKLRKHHNKTHRIRKDCRTDLVSISSEKQQIEEDHPENENFEAIDDENTSKFEKKLTDCIPCCSTFKCEICRFFLPTKNDLEEHFDTVHFEEIRCGYCKIEFQSILDMDKHMDFKHKGMWKLNDPDILREGDSEFEDEFESE